MLKLHVVQAREGDCMIVEHGTPAQPGYILVDGGPVGVYEQHLCAMLSDIQARVGGLDLAVVSHVDDDHIVGVLDLLNDLQQERAQGAPETVHVKGLWHNSFSQTLGRDVEDRFKMMMVGVPAPRGAMNATTKKERSIAQGDALTRSAGALQIPINPEFSAAQLVCLDDAPPVLRFGDLSVRVVGPARAHLKALRTKWLAWLKEQDKRKRLRSPERVMRAAIVADTSIPNLSSIMLLVESGGKTMLLPGDGRGSDLLRGLATAGLLGPDKTLHVDVLKLPHHGSARNVTRKFFSTVTADKYVVSANGMYDNPDLNTLLWLVQAAKEARRSIDLYITNATDSSRALVDQCPPDQYGYHLIELQPGEHSLVLDLGG